MNMGLTSFLDELEKISQLEKADERKQLAQFASLGATAMPAVSAVKNVIEHGKFMPPGSRVSRWLPAQMIGGALMGGAIPAFRHIIERGNVEKAQRKAETAQELQELLPGPISAEPKIAAISDEAKRTMALSGFAMGALPTAEALTSKIRMGKFMGGASPKKWLLSQIPSALLWGAAFPLADRLIRGSFPGGRAARPMARGVPRVRPR